MIFLYMIGRYVAINLHVIYKIMTTKFNLFQATAWCKAWAQFLEKWLSLTQDYAKF